MLRKLVALVALIAAAPAGGQQLVRRDGAPNPAVRPAATTIATAVRAPASPNIDGLATDAIWSEAAPVDGFRQFDPQEDVEPALKTEARFAYDDRCLLYTSPSPRDGLLSRMPSSA